jgi:hypothetical protein
MQRGCRQLGARCSAAFVTAERDRVRRDAIGKEGCLLLVTLEATRVNADMSVEKWVTPLEAELDLLRAADSSTSKVSLRQTSARSRLNERIALDLAEESA